MANKGAKKVNRLPKHAIGTMSVIAGLTFVGVTTQQAVIAPSAIVSAATDYEATSPADFVRLLQTVPAGSTIRINFPTTIRTTDVAGNAAADGSKTLKIDRDVTIVAGTNNDLTMRDINIETTASVTFKDLKLNLIGNGVASNNFTVTSGTLVLDNVNTERTGLFNSRPQITVGKANLIVKNSTLIQSDNEPVKTRFAGITVNGGHVTLDSNVGLIPSGAVVATQNASVVSQSNEIQVYKGDGTATLALSDIELTGVTHDGTIIGLDITDYQSVGVAASTISLINPLRVPDLTVTRGANLVINGQLQATTVQGDGTAQLTLDPNEKVIVDGTADKLKVEVKNNSADYTNYVNHEYVTVKGDATVDVKFTPSPSTLAGKRQFDGTQTIYTLAEKTDFINDPETFFIYKGNYYTKFTVENRSVVDGNTLDYSTSHLLPARTTAPMTELSPSILYLGEKDNIEYYGIDDDYLSQFDGFDTANLSLKKSEDDPMYDKQSELLDEVALADAMDHFTYNAESTGQLIRWTLTPADARYAVSYHFVSKTGEDLPKNVLSLKPNDETDKARGYLPTFPATFAPQAGQIDGAPGQWVFQGWNAQPSAITGDVSYTGTWEFVKNPVFTVSYKFINNTGKQLPAHISNHLDTSGKYVNAVVTSPTVTSPVRDEVNRGTWTFSGWDKPQVVLTKDETVTGEWFFTPDPVNVWQAEGNTWSYLDENSNRVVGWKLINGIWYHFNDAGLAAQGWKIVDGSWFYFESNAAMVKGWKLIDGTWFFFEESGRMKTGWLFDNNKWYYLNEGGQLASNKWVSGDGQTWYYVNEAGIMVTEAWQQIAGTWYYFNADGTMHRGWLRYANAWFYFDSNGIMVANRQMRIDNTNYTFNADGTLR